MPQGIFLESSHWRILFSLALRVGSVNRNTVATIAISPSLIPGRRPSQRNDRVTHMNAVPRKTASTIFSSADIRPRALRSFRMISRPPGSCLNRTLNLTPVR